MTRQRGVKIGVVSLRARGAAQTMTRGDGVTVLGLVGGALEGRHLSASRSLRKLIIFVPEENTEARSASSQCYTLLPPSYQRAAVGSFLRPTFSAHFAADLWVTKNSHPERWLA